MKTVNRFPQTVVFFSVAIFCFFAAKSIAHAGGEKSPGQLAQESKHCTMGDLTATLQSFPISLYGASWFPWNIKIAGLGGSVNCQFRLFLDGKPTNGERITFCEEEAFLGGVNFLYDWHAAGVSRSEAIDELDRLESTVSFGPVSGPLTDKTLIRTGYKDFVHPVAGNSVYFQEAFITQEKPGAYAYDWTLTDNGIPVADNRAEIDVVSHEEHLRRVENGEWRQW